MILSFTCCTPVNKEIFSCFQIITIVIIFISVVYFGVCCDFAKNYCTISCVDHDLGSFKFYGYWNIINKNWQLRDTKCCSLISFKFVWSLINILLSLKQTHYVICTVNIRSMLQVKNRLSPVTDSFHLVRFSKIIWRCQTSKNLLNKE